MVIGKEVTLAKETLNRSIVDYLNYLDYVWFWRIRQSHDLSTCLGMSRKDLTIKIPSNQETEENEEQTCEQKQAAEDQDETNDDSARRRKSKTKKVCRPCLIL